MDATLDKQKKNTCYVSSSLPDSQNYVFIYNRTKFFCFILLRILEWTVRVIVLLFLLQNCYKYYQQCYNFGLLLVVSAFFSASYIFIFWRVEDKNVKHFLTAYKRLPTVFSYNTVSKLWLFFAVLQTINC